MFQLPHDYHARFCFLSSFVSLGLFSWAFLFTIGNLAFPVLPFRDMSLCSFSSRLYVSLPMGHGSSLIFYRLRCCGAIGFGLCLFSFLLMSLPGVSPVLIPGLQCQRQHLACTFWFICWLAPSTLWGPAWGAQAPPSTPMLYGFSVTLPSFDNALSGTGDLFVRCVRTLLSLHVFAPNIWCSQH